MIRLLIVDDHAIVRHGLRQVVSESGDIEVAAEAGSSAEAVRLLRENTYDLVLLDISLPDKNGIDVLKIVREQYPKTQVLSLSMYPEDQYAIRALKAGAAGYLTKDTAPERLVEAILSVSRGKKYITPQVAEMLATHLVTDTEGAPHEALSDREFQTMRLIASGKQLSQIADELSLSPKTVSVYRARVLEKMQLKNNAEMTHYAIKHGLVE